MCYVLFVEPHAAGAVGAAVLNFDDDKVEEQAKMLDADCTKRGLLVRMLGSGTMVLSPVSFTPLHCAPPTPLRSSRSWTPGCCICLLLPEVSPMPANAQSLVIKEAEIDKLVGILKDSFLDLTETLGMNFCHAQKRTRGGVS